MNTRRSTYTRWIDSLGHNAFIARGSLMTPIFCEAVKASEQNQSKSSSPIGPMERRSSVTTEMNGQVLEGFGEFKCLGSAQTTDWTRPTGNRDQTGADKFNDHKASDVPW